MKYPQRQIFLAVALAVMSTSAFAQTSPTSEPPAVPTSDTGDATSPQPTTPPTDEMPVDATNSYDSTTSAQDAAPNNSAAYPDAATSADTAIATEAMTDDRNDEDRGFPWGLLGLLGLLGLIPRKARAVETYSASPRDTPVVPSTSYDSPRAP